MLKLVFQESEIGDDVPSRETSCVKVLRQERVGCLPETKAIWPQSRGGKDQSVEVSSAQVMQGLEGCGEVSGLYAEPLRSPEVWCL